MKTDKFAEELGTVKKFAKPSKEIYIIVLCTMNT